MLKRKINKAAYDGLPDALKEHYVQSGNEYVLDTDEARELLSAKDSMKKERDEAKAKLAEVEAQLAEVTKDKGDINALRESYERKLADKDKLIEEANTKLTQTRRDLIVNAKARELAKQHFKVPSLIADILARRMDLDPKDQATIRYLDANGKVSALNESEFLKEFLDNPEFADIVIANRASGSAGNATQAGSASNGGNPPFKFENDGKPVRLRDMNPEQLAAYIEARGASGNGKVTGAG